MKTGYFQDFEYPSDSEILINDQIYGKHSISEPVLVDLLKCPALLRLKGVCQHGITGLLGLTPRVTRLEHSVGAFLLVRKAGATLEEQVAALLHDVSHTTLSHVIDWALSEPGEDSFHEVHKERFIKTTNLPEILAKHGMDAKPFNEELYPLVEMPSPHLCADRLDYALRDVVGFEKVSLKDTQRIFSSLKAFPDAVCPRRSFVLEDSEIDLALLLARAYLAIDRDVWSNEAHLDMYQRTGRLLGGIIRKGAVKEEALWTLADQDFWELLRAAADPDELKVLQRLESEGLPKEDGLRLPRGAKVRTLDPDIYSPSTEKFLPLSICQPEWAIERQEYIKSRQAMRS